MRIPRQPLPYVLLALLSLLISWPYFPTKESQLTGDIKLCVEIQTNTAGICQVYYDLGEGMREPDSYKIGLRKTTEPVQIEMPLPMGVYRALRFDPTDKNATIHIYSFEIRTVQGKIIKKFPLTDLKAANQIDSLINQGNRIEIQTAEGANDPIIEIVLTDPINLKYSRWKLVATFLKHTLKILCLLSGLYITLAITSQSKWWTSNSESIRHTIKQKPRLMLGLLSLICAGISVYPIFVGRSFVSPNNGGALLLYNTMPTLPDQTDATTSPSSGSDIGAIMWAHIPYSFVQHRAIIDDMELPLWNRYNSCGTALLGQGQSCFGDPLHLIPLLAGGQAWAWDLKYLFAKTLFALGLSLLILEFTGHLPAAAICAILTPFIGYYTYRFNHPAIFSITYAPWILLPWVKATKASDLKSLVRWSIALVLINWCMLTSGTAKEAYMLLISMNLTGVLLVVCGESPIKIKGTMIGIFGAAMICFLLIASPVWITFYNTLAKSYTSYNMPHSFQVPPFLGLGLFDEYLFRPFMASSQVYIGSLNFIFLIGLSIAITSLPNIFSKQNLRGLTLSAFGISMLVFGIIPPAWINKTPFLGNVAHIDNTFSISLIVLLAVFAGFGFKYIIEHLQRREPINWLRAMNIVILLAVLMLGVAQAISRGTTFPAIGRDTNNIGLFGTIYIASIIAALVLFLVIAHFHQRRKLSTVTLVIAGVILIYACTWRNMWHIGIGYNFATTTPGERTQLDASSEGLNTIIADTGKVPARVLGLDPLLFQGWSSVYGIEGIGGPDALVNPYYKTLTEDAGLPKTWDWRYLIDRNEVNAHLAFYDMLGIKYYVDTARSLPWHNPSLIRLTDSDLTVFKSATTWPRAYFSNDIVWYDNSREVVDLTYASPTRRFVALKRDQRDFIDSARLLSDLKQSPNFTPAYNYELTTNSTVFTVDAPGAGVIALHESYLKRDFQVFLNGKPVEYFQVNHAFKGILVKAAGKYTIKFSYWPRDFNVCITLMIIGLFGLLGGFLISNRYNPLLAGTPQAPIK